MIVAVSAGRVLEWIGAYLAIGFAISIPYALRNKPEYRLVAIAAVITGIFTAIVFVIDRPAGGLAALLLGLGSFHWFINRRAGFAWIGWARLTGFWLFAAMLLRQTFSATECEWCDNVGFGGFVGGILFGEVARFVYRRRIRSDTTTDHL